MICLQCRCFFCPDDWAGNPRLYCTRVCKNAAHKKRQHENRSARMSYRRFRGRRKNDDLRCDLPGKVPYSSLAIAMLSDEMSQAQGNKPKMLYPCKAPHWHFTSEWKSPPLNWYSKWFLCQVTTSEENGIGS